MVFNQETSFSINNESDGANLFKFFANNTKIEFGLINTQNNGSLVMTNHQEHSIKVSKQAKRLSMNGATVTSIVHNHPNNSYPSGFRKKTIMVINMRQHLSLIPKDIELNTMYISHKRGV